MYEDSFCSTESSEYELNADTLDQLYKEQLQILRELVFKQSRTYDIELCRKWLKIFSKTSKAEKMARNCLCSLMQQQLQEQGTLSEPFTNLQNCNRDLERVLHELDTQSFISANYMRRAQSMRTYASHAQSKRYYHYHCNPKRRHNHHQLHCSMRHPVDQCICEFDNAAKCGDADGVGNVIRAKGACKCRGELANLYDAYVEDNSNDTRAGGDAETIDELHTECEENEKLTENLLLRRELEALRLQLTEKEIENLHLKEIAGKYEMEKSNYGNTLEGIRKSMLEAIKKALQHWGAEEQPTSPIRVFEMIFRDFETNAEFFKSIKAYDNDFEQIIEKRFENELNKRKEKIARHICHKFGKGKRRLQAKYEQRLRMQNWAQRLQLKLVKLKCFSALRQMFINAQLDKDGTGMNDKMWEVLRVLEEKYQTIVNEIV